MAFDEPLIMRRVSGRSQAKSTTPSTSSTMDSDITFHFPHESNVQASVFISAVDKEIVDDDTRQPHTLSLLTRRNALAPISLLPPEVLARVFHFLALDEPPCLPSRFEVQNLGWIRVTHVCRLWRQVALGDSTLWARIEGIPINIELIFEMLDRAGNAPLDIDIDLEEMSDPKALLMFPPHLSHTRELSLNSLSMIHSDGVRSIVSREASALEHFQLGVSVTSLIILRDFGGTTLFDGLAPRLRKLLLSQVLIPWSFIPRGQLTQLTLGLLNEGSIADAPSYYGDLDQLIDLLVNSPGLEVLVLGCCLPSQLSQVPHSQTIHLPRLSRLCLGGSSSRITNLMKMLKLPSSTTRLHFHCVSENTPTHNDQLLLPIVSAQLQSAAPAEFKSLGVTFSPVDCLLEVTASTSLPPWSVNQPEDFESDMDEEDEFVLSFVGLPELSHWTDLLERMCKMLPISNLDHLTISVPDFVDTVNWVELFERCTKVTTMQAIGRGTSSIVRALTIPKLTNTRPGGKGKKKRRDNRDDTPAQLGSSAASHGNAPIFPNLMALLLMRQDFSEYEHPSGVLFHVVQKGLRQRKAENKAPLKLLRIDNCAISAKRAKVLQKLVPKFYWDGGESIVDESEGSDEYDSDSDEPGLW